MKKLISLLLALGLTGSTTLMCGPLRIAYKELGEHLHKKTHKGNKKIVIKGMPCSQKNEAYDVCLVCHSNQGSFVYSPSYIEREGNFDNGDFSNIYTFDFSPFHTKARCVLTITHTTFNFGSYKHSKPSVEEYEFEVEPSKGILAWFGF